MAGTPLSAAEITVALRAAGSVFAEEEAELLLGEASDAQHLDRLLHQRISGLPLEHVLGWASFCGLRIVVRPGVFVPRPRTELVVREAVTRAAGLPRPLVVVDLCTGSGAVAAALADRLYQAQVYAAEIDPVAVDCARLNLARAGQDAAHVLLGDLYDPLPTGLRGRVGLLTANAPFVPTASISLMPAEARLHEPRRALDGGADGLDLLRRVISGAGAWLAPGGHVIVQASERQSGDLVRAMTHAGLRSQTVISTDLDAAVVAGQWASGDSDRVSPSAQG
jgi:release factor glutamine methyltransferase